MKIVGLDGKQYSWNIGRFTSQRGNCSDGHKRARKLLVELFPCATILEELTLPGCGKFSLYADFYLPSLKVMVEVNGQQHYKFNNHFHKSQANFRASLSRDNNKVKWCEINDIQLVVLNDEDNDDRWREQICGR